MKRTVLVYGVISGVLSSIFMLATMPFMHKISFNKGLIIGYTGMLLAFLLVFFGIRSYRENVNGGTISFGRAFSVGILIMLITCLFYVVTWEIMYFTVFPNFGQEMANQMIESARNSGGSPAEIEAQVQSAKSFAVWYQNPLLNAGATLLEPLPVGILITLISAAILRKKRRTEGASTPA